MHPLKRKFEPVLLDRYPQKGVLDESTRRGQFPDYVPMFAFPNDINIVSSDSRPRSTWHGFAMTAADNSKLHAICVILWIPMNSKTAEELEKRCEEWRRANMSEVERELAASLGERLAHERAALSRLLAKLGLVQSGSAARENLDEQISAVEEKIHMMTDMLRPLRHGAASKIEGLTDGETGLWIPRAYGILGKDVSLMSFWKEWLRAVVVPMSDGGILRIPPSSPRTGMWQPLERYVINLCTEAPSPMSSKTQVELNIRELRLFARKEAINEVPGSRSTDLYPLFRALTIPNIMVLFEYVLAESRIILLSAHTAMLHSVSNALVELIWPLTWAGVFIPVLPARLVQALEAPCPYICGIERRYENVQLPEDDFVLVDLDSNEIESTAPPPPLPRQLRRKLLSILQLAAPHHHKFGVPPGPPPYMVESFPGDSFSSENFSVFSPSAQSTSLSKLVGVTSTSFGAQVAADGPRRGLVLNAFLQTKNTRSRGGTGDRPKTASTSRTDDVDSPPITPISTALPQLPLTPASRSDSGYALQASLREKRSGHFDSLSKRSESIRMHMHRKPSLPFLGHSTSQSVSTTATDPRIATSTYAPSAYAQSTIAASTIMPGMLMQPVRNTENQFWVEGHCLQWRPSDGRCTCSICDDKADEGFYRCSGCGTAVHSRCAQQLFIVCPSAFYPEQVRAAFARCFASLFYTYRKYMQAPTAEQRKNGMIYRFNMGEFLRSLPHEHADYINVLQQTQGTLCFPSRCCVTRLMTTTAFNEFISERERTTPAPMSTSSSAAMTPNLASITLFDSIILAKRDRGRLRTPIPTLTLSRNPFSRFSSTTSIPPSSSDFLSDTSDHLWRTASASTASDSETYRDHTDFGQGPGRDYRSIVTRVPAKLDESLMREPRMVQGVPRITEKSRQQAHSRKPLPLPLREKLNGLQMHAPNGPPSPLLPTSPMPSQMVQSAHLPVPRLQSPQSSASRLSSAPIPTSRYSAVQVQKR
jgi:hypothetical protein